MEFGTQYGPQVRVHPPAGGPSRTKQAMKDECDINHILARYVRTGVMTHVSRKEPLFGDWSGVGDLRDALERAELGRAAFGRLPAKVRERFGNDPIAFLDFMAQAGREDVEALGLVDKTPEEVSKPLGAAEPA